jgi:hypothetical protein
MGVPGEGNVVVAHPPRDAACGERDKIELPMSSLVSAPVTSTTLNFPAKNAFFAPKTRAARRRSLYREGRTVGTADINVVVQVPQPGLPSVGIVKHIIRFALAVEITDCY